jgi:hypothetical protein
MATFSQKDVQNLLIGKHTTALTTGAADLLNVGEIGAFTPGGKRYRGSGAGAGQADAANGAPFVLIAKSKDGSLIRSETINADFVKDVRKKVFEADSEQVSYVGYNGASGAIEVNNNAVYSVKFATRHLIVSNHNGYYQIEGYYRSDLTATQAEIADNLTYALVANLEAQSTEVAKVTRINSAAGAATAASGTSVHGTGTLSVKKGSKYFTAEDIDGGSAGIVVGDYVRFGTTLTSDVYKVVEVDTVANIGKLDQAYTGATGTFTATNAMVITTAANFGLKLLGVRQPFIVGKKHYTKFTWDTLINSEAFGATSVTTTSAKYGSGVYEQMAELEWFVQGNEGNFYRKGEPLIQPMRQDVDLTADGYNLVDVLYSTTEDKGLINMTAQKQLTLAIPDASTTAPAFWTTATHGLQPVLETLLGLSGGALAV